jgi:hypothetical protein
MTTMKRPTEKDIKNRLYDYFGEINTIHIKEYARKVIIRFEDEDGTFTRTDWDIATDRLHLVFLDGSSYIIG